MLLTAASSLVDAVRSKATQEYGLTNQFGSEQRVDSGSAMKNQ